MYAAGLSGGRTDVGAVQSVGETMLSAAEIQRVFEHLPGAFRLMAEVLYATGLRVEELLAMRVRDVESDGWCLAVRDRQGGLVRRLRLPRRLSEALTAHMVRLQQWHEQELQRGGGEVDLGAMASMTHPLAGYRWCWQYLFPSTRKVTDLETGRLLHTHLETARVQSMLAQAGQTAQVSKSVHAHALRHAFATEYLAKGRPLTDLQLLLGHTNFATTQRYVEVLQAARSSWTSEQPPYNRGCVNRAA